MNLHGKLKRVIAIKAMAQVVSVVSGLGLFMLFMACESLPIASFVWKALASLVLFFASSFLMEAMAQEEKRIARTIRKKHQRRLAELYASRDTFNKRIA